MSKAKAGDEEVEGMGRVLRHLRYSKRILLELTERVDRLVLRE